MAGSPIVEALTPFIWGAGGSKKTPEEIAREKEVAAEILMRAGNTSPVGHWTQGMARVVDALGGVVKERRANAAGEENAAYNNTLLTDAYKALAGGSTAPVAASSMPTTTGVGEELAATSPAPANGMEAYRNAIASIESAGSGDYAAVGPTNPKLGRALGRYQIMEANIGPWSQEVLGRAVSPDEFLANPQLQDAIFDGKFGQYVEQFGPEGAAQAWFAGPGGVGKNDRKDVLGTTVGEYASKFSNALGSGPVEVAAATPEAAIEAVAPASGYVDPMVAAQPAAPALPAPVEVGPAPAVAEAPQQVAQALSAQAEPQQAGGINPAILQALTDPRATPQTRAVAQALMQQQMEQNDPLRRLQLEKGQLEIERLRNPQADIPDSVRALQLRAQQAGLQPETPEYQKFMLSGGDKGITINNEGNIPAGYQAVRDGEGRITAIQPIPGSPAALEMEQAMRAREMQGERRQTATDTITNAANEARNLIKSGTFATGSLGRLAANLTESDAAELRRQVDVLKSNATIEALTAMRQASPTGGALGNVTEKEGAMLAAAAGAIDPNASREQVEKALDNYERTLLRTIHGKRVGDAIYEQSREKQPTVIDGYQIEEVTE